MNKTCQELQDAAIQSPEAMNTWKSHATECEECRESLALYTKLQSIGRTSRQRLDRSSIAAFDQALTTRTHRNGRTVWLWAAPIAACLLLGMTLFLLHTGSNTGVAPATQSTVTTVEATEMAIPSWPQSIETRSLRQRVSRLSAKFTSPERPRSAFTETELKNIKQRLAWTRTSMQAYQTQGDKE